MTDDSTTDIQQSPLIPSIELVDSEAGNSGIDDYSRQNSDKTVTMDDVRRTISDDDAVEEAAVNFYLKDPKDVSTVMDSTNKTNK
ncbi:hypothetical protein PPTG_21855 [Phytophthora nicotianae INRA-310]|uniref:Uncharacterized protein n=1 Tax=Phytophthora nicotianae (strain INRA-310) TaxID=761204 RepID=W2QSC1_PHYN3|nr:hypothetical protein PPTG_21855 [Phytophthora nicotianae INRA-310]ETN16018.1 hypothetical protein PPTG_21855 [Phytophthora nicotianae INRA-310]